MYLTGVHHGRASWSCISYRHVITHRATGKPPRGIGGIRLSDVGKGVDLSQSPGDNKWGAMSGKDHREGCYN
jgi:hypothetical protein